jgi:hypothetical protein
VKQEARRRVSETALRVELLGVCPTPSVRAGGSARGYSDPIQRWDQADPGVGFRAMSPSIAFRWGTPLAVETNSTCPESKICQSQ